jgi:hypothetical protein
MAKPPLVLPVVNSILMARLCELEGFQAAFMGGSGASVLQGEPNVASFTARCRRSSAPAPPSS